jgi:hypothetical protein
MSKIEEGLYKSVKQSNLSVLADCLIKGAQNTYTDNNNWTALDLAAFKCDHVSCSMILSKVPYGKEWNGQRNCPLEKVITKNVQTGIGNFIVLFFKTFWTLRLLR